MDSVLKAEFQYYIDHQNELVQKFEGRVIVIKGQQVIGVYDSDIGALQAMAKDHPEYPVGSFLVQKCEPGKESYTQTFHSRVVFA